MEYKNFSKFFDAIVKQHIKDNYGAVSKTKRIGLHYILSAEDKKIYNKIIGVNNGK